MLRVLARRRAIAANFRAFSSVPSDPYERAALKRRGGGGDAEGRPAYATSDSHKQNVVDQRFKNVSEDHGQRPTAWQRRFLVLTKLYQSQNQIPDVVAQGTLNRMHDRLRVVFIVAASSFFFVVFLIGEKTQAARIARDAGNVNVKM